MLGEYGEVLVMDWGLAKVQDDHPEPTADYNPAGTSTLVEGLTLEGQVLGTPQYMSPEQASGLVDSLDARSDIYTLGGILYALLALRPPVEGGSLDEVLSRVKTGQIRPMLTQQNGVPESAPRPSMDARVPRPLQAVIRKAMALAPANRYANVVDLEAEIDAYQSGFST